MKVGIIGLGRMGEGMSRRLLLNGIKTVGYRRDFSKTQALVEAGGLSEAAASPASVLLSLQSEERRVLLLVIPAANVDRTLDELRPSLRRGDIVIDHGNSNFKDSRRRALELAELGVDFLDCGTSGGVYGLDRGYCLMVGGATAAVGYATPVFQALSPEINSVTRTSFIPQQDIRPGEQGWLHCGAAGAGHFVKMVHNGVEYGIMQAYAEGFNILKSANLGASYVAEGDAEVAPMADPENYQYEIDVKEVSELWRRGSVIGSWLLDLTAEVMLNDENLDDFDAGVSDSGEGRWTVNAAVDLGVPAPVLSTALFERFSSRKLGNFAYRVLNGMRYMFGGHHTR